MVEQKHIDRFWAKVEKKDKDSCWEWTAYRDKDGYGQLGFIGKSPWKAHRISWFLHSGEIPAGMLICHHCDNPGCVNPNHLFLGTQTDNLQDASKKGRVKNNYKILVGEDNGSAKLTKEQVLSIRNEYENMNKKNKKKLARKYKVDPKTISNIVNRKNWRHI